MARVGRASCAQLTGRVALVTGAATAVGRAVAAALADAGATVIAIGHSKKQRTSYRTIAADVTEEGAVAEIVRRCLNEFSRIDILVNTSTALQAAPMEKITEAVWERAMRINLVSAFLCAKAVVPSMIERREGRIINLTVAGAFTGVKNNAHYAAAAGGILGFSKSLALELAPHQITVNTICPDPYAATRKKVVPAAFAGPAVFLAGNQAAYVTGQTVFIDGKSVYGIESR